MRAKKLTRASPAECKCSLSVCLSLSLSLSLSLPPPPSPLSILPLSLLPPVPRSVAEASLNSIPNGERRRYDWSTFPAKKLRCAARTSLDASPRAPRESFSADCQSTRCDAMPLSLSLSLPPSLPPSSSSRLRRGISCLTAYRFAAAPPLTPRERGRKGKQQSRTE